MKILPFTYRISSEKTLFNDQEIDLSTSECIGIIGPVGSGKSQFIKLLADYQLHDVGAFSEYPFCAYLSQDLTRLFTGNTPDSILDMYCDSKHTVGQHFDRDLFSGYCKKLNITDLVNKNRRLTHYSEGERQRLGICLAAAVLAPVTILDEPTTALDIGYRQILYSLINDIKKRSKVFVISHRLLDCLETCGQMIWMENLDIADSFPVEQMIEKSHILSYYSVNEEDRHV